HASRRRADRGVLRVGGRGAPRIDRAGAQEGRRDRRRPRWHPGPISRADRPPHPRERGGQLAPSAHLHSGRRDDCGGPRESVEGKASLSAARRMARCRIAEGPPAGFLRGPEGVAAPPPGSDPDPLMRLLSNASPQVEAFRGRTFYGLLELPAYSDAKLTHIYGDSRLIRGALDEAWSWLKAIREDERRSLQIQWS